KKVSDDLSLCGSGLLRPGSTSAGVLHGKVKRHGAGFVFPRRIAACLEKESYSSGTARAYGSVQGSSTILVLGIDVGAGVEQAADGFDLPFRIPRGAVNVAVRCVV